MPKKIKDQYDDATLVAAVNGNVEVEASSYGYSTGMCFTPKQARKLAKALKKAARAAEASRG